MCGGVSGALVADTGKSAFGGFLTGHIGKGSVSVTAAIAGNDRAVAMTAGAAAGYKDQRVARGMMSSAYRSEEPGKPPMAM